MNAAIANRPNSQKPSLFLSLLAATPLIELTAGTSLWITYLLYGYRILLLSHALIITRRRPQLWRDLKKDLRLPALYVATFLITTMFGTDLEYSIRYRALFLPVLVVDFFLWYVAGHLFSAEQLFSRITYFTLAFASLSVLFATTGLLDAEATRVIYGLDVPIAIAPAIAMNNFPIAVALILASLASLKKTVVLCAAISIAFALILRIKYPPQNADQKRKIMYGRLVTKSLVYASATAAAIIFVLPFVEQTVARLALEREDLYRLAMAQEFYRLIGDYFPFGTGYYTFGSLTRDALPYTTYAADGTELSDGMSLHNTLMHVTLEGGLPILLILLALWYQVISKARAMLHQPKNRIAGIVIITWLASSFAYGMFNQLHATRYYFGTIGFAFGFYASHSKTRKPN